MKVKISAKRLWPKLRGLAINLVLMSVSLLIGLLCIEALLRLTYPADELGWAATHRADDELGWTYIRGSSQWHTSPGEFRTFVKINQNGLRDEDIPYEKPAELYRVMMIGDSFVASLQTPLAQSFVKVTEERLNQVGSQPDQKVQVVNAGIGGYGTDQELRWFRQEGIKYDLDMVVLVIYIGNDIADNDYELSALAVSTLPPKPFFQLKDGRLQDMGFVGINTELSGDQGASILSLRRYLQKNSRAFMLASAALVNLEGQPYFQKMMGLLGQSNVDGSYNHTYDIFAETPAPAWERAWELTNALITTMRDEVEATGAEFRVVLIPHPVQVHQDWWEARVALYPVMARLNWNLFKPNQQLTNVLAENEIPYLDLQPVLIDYVAATGSYIYYRSNGHFTVEGNQVTGQEIAGWLAETWR